MVRTVKQATGHGAVKSECPQCRRMLKAHFRVDGPAQRAECECGAVLVIVPAAGDWYLGEGARAWREDGVA